MILCPFLILTLFYMVSVEMVERKKKIKRQSYLRFLEMEEKWGRRRSGGFDGEGNLMRLCFLGDPGTCVLLLV